MKQEVIDLAKFFENLKNESDRGVVLISAELINNHLTDLFEAKLALSSKLRKDILENPSGPLNTLSNKIKMAYSLGFIDKKHYECLETMRSIRNKFAHRIFDASFGDREIIDWCKRIDIPRIPGYDPNNYRHLFYDAAYYLAGYLRSRTSLINRNEQIIG